MVGVACLRYLENQPCPRQKHGVAIGIGIDLIINDKLWESTDFTLLNICIQQTVFKLWHLLQPKGLFPLALEGVGSYLRNLKSQKTLADLQRNTLITFKNENPHNFKDIKNQYSHHAIKSIQYTKQQFAIYVKMTRAFPLAIL